MELENAVIPTDKAAPMSFVLACSKFFGRLPNQTLNEFNQELKALTPRDRLDFQQMFADAGWSVLV